MIKANDFSLFSRLYGLEKGIYLIRLWDPEKHVAIHDIIEVGNSGAYFNYPDNTLHNFECVWVMNIKDLPVEDIDANGRLLSLQNLKIGVIEHG